MYHDGRWGQSELEGGNPKFQRAEETGKIELLMGVWKTGTEIRLEMVRGRD